jgi:hypothetical protein
MKILVGISAAALAMGLAGLLAAAEEAWVTEPFNGKDLDGWKVKGPEDKTQWKVGLAALDPEKPNLLVCKEGAGEMVNVVGGSHGKGLDMYSTATWGDCRIELEVMVPKGSNSGIYVMGEYEIQVLDSFGKQKVGPGDMGGIYGASPPKVNASKAPGEWQKYEIDFRAPKFGADGKKTANAVFLKVVLNGQVIHENVEIAKSTGGPLAGKEAPTGPIMFQGNHGPVAFRNIKVTPLKAEAK